MFVDSRTTYRKAFLVGLLDRLCAELDISAARREQAEQRYNGVAEWLAQSDHFLLRGLSIYLQGSTALGTSVRPFGRNEHDVDLVAFMPDGREALAPAYVKGVVGDRLKENGIYRKLLEEKQRCWRLVYANEFHLDITPAILNVDCSRAGELVPDRSVREWKESNPRGYRSAFERRAALVPLLRITKALLAEDGARTGIEPFPVATRTRSLLCRIVQVAKRHRDFHFVDLDPTLAPISVILTTLIAWSYEACVLSGSYDTEFDVVLDVLRRMPTFVQRTLPDGKPGWYVPNETTHGENFAERWNEGQERARAFFSWHAKAVADLEDLARVDGTDRVRLHMDQAFGPRPVAGAFTALDDDIARARSGGLLKVAPTLGIVAAPAAAPAAVPVRRNTFYGRHMP